MLFRSALKVMWEVRDRAARDMGDPVRLAELMVAFLLQNLAPKKTDSPAQVAPILKAEEERLSPEQVLAELVQAGVAEET